MLKQRRGQWTLSDGNHIKVIALTATLISGCNMGFDETPTNFGEKMMSVSPESYSQSACWKHKDGSFRAFLVLGKNGNYAVPDFISVNCMIKEGPTNDAEATLLHVGTILMLDTNGLIQRRFPNFRIGGNVASDQPFPSASSDLYYFKADVDKVNHPYKKVYSPSKIKTLINTHTSVGEFIHLSPKERERLLQSIKD